VTAETHAYTLQNPAPIAVCALVQLPVCCPVAERRMGLNIKALPALSLLEPSRLFSRSEVMTRSSPAPAKSGVYAWYFAEVPPGVDATRCHMHGDKALLYIGISPSAPPRNGRALSRSTIRRRLQTHFGGNASGSTLRLTLGCLLRHQLNIDLRRVGSTGRYTFTNPGEQQLDDWMAAYAFVTWHTCEQPWEAEGAILRSGLPLPLNIADNPCVAHTEYLSPIRREARARANQHPVIRDNGGPRRRT
jgi:hypothetical protein